MPSYYTTATVVAAADALDGFNPFIRDTFFGTEVTFETEEVVFDDISRRRKIAPFVSPKLPGKERDKRTGEVSAYKPPYLKPKDTLSPQGAMSRRGGEAIGGEMALLDRHEQQEMQTLADHENECRGREELMCCQLLQTGHMVAVGEGIEDDIDYGRDAELTVALLAAARWGETGVKVLDSLRAWRRLVASKSGASPSKVILGYGASELLTKDEDVRAILDIQRQASGMMALAGNASGGVDDVARLIGVIDGVEYWEYTQTYEDDSGSDQHFWPEFGVGLVSKPRFNGHMTYGAIMDLKSLQAEKRFTKKFEEEDPSREVMLTQSAPLPVPVDVNASFFGTVR